MDTTTQRGRDEADKQKEELNNNELNKSIGCKFTDRTRKRDQFYASLNNKMAGKLERM